ncbi:PREDICTED: dormancy-associated protein homolog 4 [Nelumbo nucifera]|uniref:Dormancy-associated protein homolog 4 n=1 Tax=Nelumbo nucifera TaxID=4432 RepID=A0A1U8A5L1_NELNU|nr:PREDICTED: dormancy-associated protein homolog 4 [Nelumbo nucifera]
MGFLDKLWDDIVAGPKPETGLGKLRKYDSFSASRPPPLITDDIPISRSITIIKTNSKFRNFSGDSGSVPSSPAGSNTPGSPFSPATPGEDFRRLMRRKSTSEVLERAQPRSPTVYDWVVISALDR